MCCCCVAAGESERPLMSRHPTILGPRQDSGGVAAVKAGLVRGGWAGAQAAI